MQLSINGQLREVDDGLSIAELIEKLQLKSERVAVELNHEIVRRADWAGTILKAGDSLEIVHFVGGGCG